MVPQTVGFEMRVYFNQRMVFRCKMLRPADKPRSIDLVFHSLEKMLDRYRTERKRRALADRATSAQYRMFLTDHGRAQVAADDDCRKRHEDAINGKWFDV